MTFDTYMQTGLARVDGLLRQWAGLHGAGPGEAVAALAVVVLVVWMGAIGATRLVAQVSSGAALGMVVCWAVLLFADNASVALYHLGPGAQAAAGVACLYLMVFSASRILNVSLGRAGATMALTAGFGGLASVLLALFLQLWSAI